MCKLSAELEFVWFSRLDGNFLKVDTLYLNPGFNFDEYSYGRNFISQSETIFNQYELHRSFDLCFNRIKRKKVEIVEYMIFKEEKPVMGVVWIED